MDRYLYRDILLFEFVPFMAAKYDFDCVLHQDNDAKHTSALCREIFKENKKNWVR